MKSSHLKFSRVLFSLFLIAISLSACVNNPKEESVAQKSMQLDLKMPAAESISADLSESLEKSPLEPLRSSKQEANSAANVTTKEQAAALTKDKKIIKDGSLGLKTKNLVESKLRLDALVKSLNGYYESENFNNDAYRNAYDLRIRIPSQNFEKLLTSIESSSEEVLNKNISARDVTEEYMDIETRLSTKRDYLKRYRELLTKAGSVKDMLEIEEQIRVLQEEIESQEGRLKFLADQVAFSSLSINLFTPKEFVYKPSEEASFLERMKSSFSAGWRGIVSFIVALASVWPLLIVLGLIAFFGGKKLKNKLKSKTTSANN